MPKTIGNIPVAVEGDSDSSHWAKKVENHLTSLAHFQQGRIEGDQFGIPGFKFMVNTATNKLAMYEKLGDNWMHKLDFGSVITDRFVSTRAMGGLQIQADDGYDYTIARTSPTGNGISGVLGNYASATYTVSNTEGLWHVYETQQKFKVVVNSSTTETTGTGFEAEFNLTDNRMHYGGTVYFPALVADSTVGMRLWVTDTATGKILHETISSEEWVASAVLPLEHQVRYGVEKWERTAGDTSAWLPNSIPFPVFGSEGARTWHWEFREAVTILGASSSSPKIEWETEELIKEQIATREYIDRLPKVEELPKGAGTHVLTTNTTYIPDADYQYENERYKFEDKAGTVKIRGKLTFILSNNTPFFEIEQSNGNYNRANMTLDLSDCYLFNNPMGFQQGVFIRKSCGNVVIERSQISLRSGTFIENVAYNWVYKPDVITKCNILIYDSLFEQIFYNQHQRFVTLIIKDNTIHMSGRLVYIWYSQPHYRHFDVSGNYIKNWGKLGTIHSDYYNPSNPALDLGAVFRFCDNQIELIQGYSLIWYNAHANLLTHGNLNIENNRVKSNYSRLNNVNELHYADPRSVCHTMDARLVKGIGVLPAMNAYNYSEGVTGRKYKGKPIYRTEVDGSRSFGSTLTENNINGVTEIVDCKLTYTDGASNKYRYTVDNMYISSSQQARIGVDTAGAYAGWLRIWVAGYTLNSAWVEFIR